MSIFDLIMMEGQLVDIRVREKKGAEALPEKDKRTAEEFIRTLKRNYKGGSDMGRIYIIDAENLGNLTVSLTFNDNTKQTVDVGDFIRRHPHPQYNKYLDPRKFSRFTIDNGNIVWGKNWDLIFPIEQLYSGNLS